MESNSCTMNSTSLLDEASDSEETFRYEGWGTNMLNSSREINEQEFFQDVTLIAGVDGVKVRANRNLLVGHSQYFLNMFQNNMEEEGVEEVEIKDVDGAILHLIVKYLYTGKIDLDTGVVKSVFLAANYLIIESLIQVCCEYIAMQLNVKNCVGILVFAKQHNLNDLAGKAFAFVHENPDEMYGGDDFLLSDEE